MIVPRISGRTITSTLMRDAVASSARNLREMYYRTLGHTEGFDNFKVRQTLSRVFIETANRSI